MNYKETRQRIKTGDTLLGAGNWPVSRLVRLFTGQQFSHVGIAIWLQIANRPRLCMFESMEGRDVRIVPLYKTLITQYWKNGGKMWYAPIIEPTIDGDKVADFYLQHWGDLYANKYQFLVGMSGLIRLIRQFRGANIDTDENKWHCSEIAIRALMAQGYKHEKDPSITTPGDVALASCLGWPIEITST